MILTKEDDSESALPANLPELMLSYLNELYHNASRDELRSVQQDAKRIAWECLRSNLTPAAAEYDKVVQALDGDSVEERINILEQNLRLITTFGAAQDKIRFNLDPLAEYLAALFLVETYPEDGQFWEAIIDRFHTPSSNTESITEFVLAICECWTLKAMDLKFPKIAKDLFSLRNPGTNLKS
jgi:hypothetical protein